MPSFRMSTTSLLTALATTLVSHLLMVEPQLFGLCLFLARMAGG